LPTCEVDLFEYFFGVLFPVSVDRRGDEDEAVDGVGHVDVKVRRSFVAIQRRSEVWKKMFKWHFQLKLKEDPCKIEYYEIHKS